VKRAIAVIANDRPKYLRLTLDGLSRCSGIEDWDLYVYVDGPASEKPVAFSQFMPAIPMTLKHRREKLGVLWNTINSIYETFCSDAYDAVMWVEDDMLVRQDLLEVASKYLIPGLASFREGGASKVRYTPPPNLIGRALFFYMYQWIKDEKYVGIWDAVRNRAIPKDVDSHDCVVGTFVHEANVVVAREPESYVLHFGIRGKNQRAFLDDPEQARIEAAIFGGQPSTWIKNLLEVFRTLDNTHEMHKLIYPKDFVYPKQV